jgi:hypothetical protein
MRAIDDWVGIPLVFLLTIVSRVQRFIGLATSPVGRSRNILFIQLAEMGTMVVAYLALRMRRDDRRLLRARRVGHNGTRRHDAACSTAAGHSQSGALSWSRDDARSHRTRQSVTASPAPREGAVI